MNLDELEAAARAAQDSDHSGPWHMDRSRKNGRTVLVDNFPNEGKFYRRIATLGQTPDAEMAARYIAAASPDVVLALLEMVRELRAAHDRIHKALSDKAAEYGQREVVLLTRIKNHYTEIRAAVDRILAGEDPRAVFEDFGVFDDALAGREESGK